MSSIDVDQLLTEQTEKIVNMVQDYCGKRVAHNLETFSSLGKILLEMPGADFDGETWSGELLIHFASPMTARQVINYFVCGSGADEIQFVDDDTLRLWWD